jgi:hypothetical protein
MENKEVWKQYKDTCYSVSNHGNIRNDKTGKDLNPAKSRQGYVRLNLWHNGKSRSVAVHILIAEMFIENPEGLPIVNHKNGNPSDNRAANLEWSTYKLNVLHAFETGLASRGEDSVHAILCEADVVEILKLGTLGEKPSAIAKIYDMSVASISHILHGETWKHVEGPRVTTTAYVRKLSTEDIPVIRKLFKDGKTDEEIAKMYSLARASIRNIRIGKNWKNY